MTPIEPIYNNFCAHNTGRTVLLLNVDYFFIISKFKQSLYSM
jgi:hypothetical protein